MSGLMAGKRGLIMGLANDKSLAWGIAKQLGAHGAELAFSYQGEALKKRVGPLAEQLEAAAHPVRSLLGLGRGAQLRLELGALVLPKIRESGVDFGLCAGG